jgi:hypothetical protein
MLDPLPCHFNLQLVEAVAPFLTSDLEASPVSLHEMARNNNYGKRPWREGPSHVGQSPPPHRMRMVVGLGWVSVANR